MFRNAADNVAGSKHAPLTPAMASTVIFRQWLLRQLTLGQGLIDRGRGLPTLRPPEYRDLLQARPSDVLGLS